MSGFVQFFEQFARQISLQAGRPLTFFIACLLILVWALTGPIFNYSDTWQLVINTGTTIITFLMIFLVQSAQNRDAKALQLKLDELIYKMRPASNVMIDIEDLTEQELDVLAKKYKKLRHERAERNSKLRASEGKQKNEGLLPLNGRPKTRKKKPKNTPQPNKPG